MEEENGGREEGRKKKKNTNLSPNPTDEVEGDDVVDDKFKLDKLKLELAEEGAL